MGICTVKDPHSENWEHFSHNCLPLLQGHRYTCRRGTALIPGQYRLSKQKKEASSRLISQLPGRNWRGKSCHNSNGPGRPNRRRHNYVAWGK